MKKGDKAGEIMAGRKREVSIVAEDQNWRSYVHNELKCAEIWNSDWGFLTSQGGKYNSFYIVTLPLLSYSNGSLK